MYKGGQAGVTRATVTITFDNSDSRQSPLGYETYEEITVSRQVSWLSSPLSPPPSHFSSSSSSSISLLFLLFHFTSLPPPLSSHFSSSSSSISLLFLLFHFTSLPPPLSSHFSSSSSSISQTSIPITSPTMTPLPLRGTNDLHMLFESFKGYVSLRQLPPFYLTCYKASRVNTGRDW